MCWPSAVAQRELAVRRRSARLCGAVHRMRFVRPPLPLVAGDAALLPVTAPVILSSAAAIRISGGVPGASARPRQTLSGRVPCDFAECVPSGVIGPHCAFVKPLARRITSRCSGSSGAWP